MTAPFGGLCNSAFLACAGVVFDATLKVSDGPGDHERKREDNDYESPEFLHEEMLRIKLEQFAHADNRDQ